MALPAILYDFDVQLNHLDRGIERRIAVRAARHPSEALERLWLRVLAYCWQWEERIAFGPGLCDPDAPDLLATDLTGSETLWVRVGRPDPDRLQREADRHRLARVVVLFESPQRLETFVADAVARGLDRLARVELAAVPAGLLDALATRDDRRSRFSLTIVGDHLYLERDGRMLEGPLTRGRAGTGRSGSGRSDAM